MSLTVNPITPASFTAWQITQANALDVEEALATVAQLGWKGTTTDYIQPNSGGTLVWTVGLSRSGYATLTGYNGNWIVSDGTNVTILTNPVFISTYTVNVALAWAPTTIAPTATLNPDSTVTLSFPQPTSPNGPWTYSASGGGTVGEFSTDVNGNVTAQTSVLSAGDYTWTVTVATQYEGVTATSAATQTITVPVPGS